MANNIEQQTPTTEREGRVMKKVDLLKSEEGRETLAGQFAKMLDQDSTEPAPDRDKWLGEKELRDFESVAFPEKLEGEFAEMSEKAAGMAKEETNKLVFELQRINGLRRLPEGKRNDELIKELFESAKESIDELDDSPRKTRLESLRSYSESVYRRTIGDYLHAIEQLKRSAQLAEKMGDESSKAIANLCITVEQINHALVNNPESLKSLLAAQRNAEKALYETLQGKDDPTSVRWEMYNGPAHLLLAHFWANERYGEADADSERLLKLREANPEMAEKLNSGITMALATYHWGKGEYEEAKRLAISVLDGSAGELPSPEYVAGMHILLGRAAAAEENMAEAESRLREAMSIEGSAHQARAVAERELKALKA